MAHFSPAIARAAHRDCFLCLASVFFSCPRLNLSSQSRAVPLRAATSISSAHDRFNLFDGSFGKHRSLLTCGRALAAAWRPRGGRGGRVGVAGADRDRTLSAHLNFFFPKGYLTRSAMSGWGKNERTNEQTHRLKVFGLVPLPKVGNPGYALYMKVG